MHIFSLLHVTGEILIKSTNKYCLLYLRSLSEERLGKDAFKKDQVRIYEKKYIPTYSNTRHMSKI